MHRGLYTVFLLVAERDEYLSMLSVYLWKRAVELVDGVHYIQQHVVANHKFTLWVR